LRNRIFNGVFLKLLLLALLDFPLLASAKIEDNSFLLEEAYNQEWGVYQFIQKYQTSNKGNLEYSFGNEIAISDKVHQFSYEFAHLKSDGQSHSKMGDTTLNYRWQPLNKDGFLVAERIGLIVPTGSVADGTSSGVVGFEFMQAATLTLSDRWMNHWNLGFEVLPNAKTAGQTARGTATGFTAATSLIYLLSDNFNLMFETILQTGQSINPDETKDISSSVTLNPGFRWAWDFDWKDTQIVPGVSFPTEILNNRTEQSVLFYLSIEPKFY
jgi:hypothetical protein